MDDLYHLPALPPAVRALTSAESERISGIDTYLPTSPTECITCRGVGTFRFYGVGDEVVTYECPCADQWKLHRFLVHCGLPYLYQTLRWADLMVGEDELAPVYEWLASMDRHLVTGYGMRLSGRPGGGKTLVSTLLFRQAVILGTDCFFTTFSDLISEQMEVWRGDRDDRSWYERRLRNARLLVIDDVGREHRRLDKGVAMSHESSRFTLEDILRHRVQSRLATVVTSNLGDEDTAQRYERQAVELFGEATQLVVLDRNHRPEVFDRLQGEIRSGIVRPVTLA